MLNLSENDIELWRSLRQGDKLALEKLYYRYIDHLMNYGLKFTKELSMVEDAIQDLFIIIWNSREKLSDTDSVKNYLMGAFRNNLIKNIQQLSKTSHKDDFSQVPFDIEATIEQEIILGENQSEKQVKLAEGMKKLSSRQREAIYLRYYEEKDYEEICLLMNINYQSVRNLISTGIKSLKENA